MKLPSKITTYKQSIISKFHIILNVVCINDIHPRELFKKTKDSFNGMDEFITTLDCLFALKKNHY